MLEKRWCAAALGPWLALAIAAPAHAQFDFNYQFELPSDLELIPILPERDIQFEGFGMSLPPGSEFMLPDDDVNITFDLVTSVNYTLPGQTIVYRQDRGGRHRGRWLQLY